MDKQKRKPAKIPKDQAQLLEQYRKAYKQQRPTSLKEILELREQFRARGMVI